MNIARLLQQAIQHHQSGRLREAEALYRQILTADSRNVDALNLLGVIATQVGRYDAAIQLIQSALSINPNFPLAQYNLGNAHMKAGNIDPAIAAYKNALAMKPDYPEVLNNLGHALTTQGKNLEAFPHFQRAAQLQPDLPDTQFSLANIYRKRGDLDQAVTAYKNALKAMPRYPDRPARPAAPTDDKPESDAAASLETKTDFSRVHNGLANTLKDKANLDEAIAQWRAALELNPAYTPAHSNLVYTLLFHPAFDPQKILQEHLEWNAHHAAPLSSNHPPFENDRNPNRRLRLGYVSPDFRDHCQALFMLPLLAAHNHEKFEIFCYSSAETPDPLTDRHRAHADVWRETRNLSNSQLAEQIRADKIDLLVDLTMHMANSRLGVFARKPAPVQVSWLAYPGTTGLTAIDYRLTDVYLDPPGEHDAWYSERSVRLPETFWCYDPLTTEPTVNALPALSAANGGRAGRITFGCLNNFCKLNPATVELWGQALERIPGSRILILSEQGDHREWITSILRGRGAVEFLTKRPRSQYLQLYHQIDICLDTFPYNGHTTSLDSYWMGVPVISMRGETAVARAGFGQLSNLGLPDLCADTPEQFVEIAVNLAQNLPRLATLRAGLRERLEKSPLMDAPRFARNIEHAYREMWRTCCTGNENE